MTDRAFFDWHRVTGMSPDCFNRLLQLPQEEPGRRQVDPRYTPTAEAQVFSDSTRHDIDLLNRHCSPDPALGLVNSGVH